MAEERLGPEHAEHLAELELSYPEEMQMGLEVIRQKLETLERSGYSFSWILFERERPTAFLIAYPGTSNLDVPEPDPVIYIGEMIVERNRPHDFYRLLSLMVDDLEERNLAHLAIEAVCRRGVYDVVKEHPRVIARLGYELSGQYEYWDDKIGEEVCWMRWMPLRAPEVIAQESFTFSEDLLEELSWFESRLGH